MKAAGILGGLGVALLAIFCCAGIPILIAVGAAVSTAALLGGIGAAVGVAILGVALVALWRRRQAGRLRPSQGRRSAASWMRG